MVDDDADVVDDDDDDDADDDEDDDEDELSAGIRRSIMQCVKKLGCYVPHPETDPVFFERMMLKLSSDSGRMDKWFEEPLLQLLLKQASAKSDPDPTSRLYAGQVLAVMSECGMIVQQR